MHTPHLIDIFHIHYRKILFVATFILFMMWIYPFQSMIAESSDAADIWQTIKTFYNNDTYVSYVLYKGFMSVYPYVWLYQLSLLFHINEFFFVMLYHAFLFTYIAVNGLPEVIYHLTRYKAKIYQRILLIIILFIFWSPTKALNNVMVDLPSCAIFILACNCAIQSEYSTGRKRYIVL